jgi:predicted MFS family arabinose efflux permease
VCNAVDESSPLLVSNSHQLLRSDEAKLPSQEPNLALIEPLEPHLSCCSRLLFAVRLAFSSKVFFFIFFVGFLQQVAEFGIEETEALYLKLRFDFNRNDRSYYLIATGVPTFFVMSLLQPCLSARLGERRLVILALLISICHSLTFILVTEKEVIYLIPFIGSFGFMTFPTLIGLLSKRVIGQQQGTILGSMSGMVTAVLKPSLVYSYLYVLL